MAVFDTLRSILKGESPGDRLVRFIRQHIVMAHQEIEEAESVRDSKQLNQCARALHHFVLHTARTRQAIKVLGAVVEQATEERQLDTALGAHLAMRLVICGVALDQLEDAEWNKGSWEICGLQSYLEEFLQRHGFEAWPAPYQDNYTFEDHRRRYLTKIAPVVQRFKAKNERR